LGATGSRHFLFPLRERKENGMKIPVIIAACLASSIGFAQSTNHITITFTNSSGILVSNAEVVSHTDSKLVYRTPTGGGTVKFANLPPQIQQEFSYDSNVAAVSDTLDKIKNDEDA
jgi:hypothetical protein